LWQGFRKNKREKKGWGVEVAVAASHARASYHSEKEELSVVADTSRINSLFVLSLFRLFRIHKYFMNCS